MFLKTLRFNLKKIYSKTYIILISFFVLITLITFVWCNAATTKSNHNLPYYSYAISILFGILFISLYNIINSYDSVISERNNGIISLEKRSSVKVWIIFVSRMIGNKIVTISYVLLTMILWIITIEAFNPKDSAFLLKFFTAGYLTLIFYDFFIYGIIILIASYRKAKTSLILPPFITILFLMTPLLAGFANNFSGGDESNIQRTQVYYHNYNVYEAAKSENKNMQFNAIINSMYNFNNTQIVSLGADVKKFVEAVVKDGDTSKEEWINDSGYGAQGFLNNLVDEINKNNALKTIYNNTEIFNKTFTEYYDKVTNLKSETNLEIIKRTDDDELINAVYSALDKSNYKKTSISKSYYYKNFDSYYICNSLRSIIEVLENKTTIDNIVKKIKDINSKSYFSEKTWVALLENVKSYFSKYYEEYSTSPIQDYVFGTSISKTDKFPKLLNFSYDNNLDSWYYDADLLFFVIANVFNVDTFELNNDHVTRAGFAEIINPFYAIFTMTNYSSAGTDLDNLIMISDYTKGFYSAAICPHSIEINGKIKKKKPGDIYNWGDEYPFRDIDSISISTQYSFYIGYISYGFAAIAIICYAALTFKRKIYD